VDFSVTGPTHPVVPTPEDRCGFTYTREDGDQHSCYRRTWRDTDRCVWHAEVHDEDGKPDDALRSARAAPSTRSANAATGPSELLDGARLVGETVQEAVDLSGASLRDADLRDVDLRDADLSEADLRDADLRDADLRGADLSGAACWDAEFNDAYMLGADCRGTSFRGADLTDATLREADLTGANLEGAFLDRADLLGTDLSDVRAYGVVLAGARADETTVLDDRCIYDPVRDDYEVTERGPDPLMKAAGTYQEFEKLCGENALLTAKSRYFVRRQDIHTSDHRDEGRWGHWLRARLSRAVVLYGESPSRVLAAAALVILSSALLYPLGGLEDGATGEPLTYPPPGQPVEFAATLVDSVYFSTLTFTTMTYGHLVPVGFGKFLTMFETAAGVVLIALLVFVYGRRAAR
jgi:hypothetical protein